MSKYTDDIEIEIPREILVDYYKTVQALIDACPECIPDQLVSEYAALKRKLPRGTPYPGPWLNARTKYLVEPMDNLAPSSPVIETVMCKPSQFGATAGLIENWVAYVIENVPGPMMYVSATDKLLKKWVNKRLSPLLISCGLDDRIFAQNVLQGSRTRTGNEMFSKEFPGGSLDMVTANSAPSLRMDSIRYLALDEVSAYKWDLGGEGDPTALAEARTKAWKRRRKILYNSSPVEDEQDHIWPLYAEGDQRRYFIPCPFCGKMMLPDWGEDNKGWASNLNLKWETKAGELDESTIQLPCPLCREAIFEADKWKMVQSGEWRPTARPVVKYRRSYQASAVISLMDEWPRIVGDEIKGDKDESRRRTHVINNLGITYKELGSRPKTERIIENKGYYKRGTVPNDVLFLTMAIDVQLGSIKHKKTNPSRLEAEICGHGLGYRTWSIDYKVFKGDVDNGYKGAWQAITEWAEKGGFEFYRDDGFKFVPRLVLVDSRVNEAAVLDFCGQNNNVFPIKGFRELKESESGKGLGAYLDEKHYRDIDKIRPYKRGDHVFYLISTNHYKDAIYKSLLVPRRQGEIQAPRFCDFPRDYDNHYFEMLTAEEKRSDGSYFKPSSRANEALDCRVYNMAAHDIWLGARLKEVRDKMKKAGVPESQTEFIKTRHVLEELRKATQRKTIDNRRANQ
jgi:phage terminase large subunit GpA-like protein